MKHALYPTLFAVVLVALWLFLTEGLDAPAYILPTPIAVARDLYLHGDYYFTHATRTLLEALLGFTFAMCAGLTLGGLSSVSRTTRYTLMPYATALQTVPLVAVAPLLILWLGNGLLSKIAMAALICFFPVVVSATKGFMSVPGAQVALASIYGASRWQIFWSLRLPNSIPFCMSGISTAAPLSMIGAIVAEYAGSDRGLGYLLIQATYRLDSVQLLTSVALAAMGGLLLSSMVLMVGHGMLKKYSY